MAWPAARLSRSFTRIFGGWKILHRSNVALSENRLSQLLEAEITTMAMQEARSMSLQDVMDLGKQPAALAELLNEELPVRYARRISMLEALPEWQTKESIRHVREMYVKSFKELRMVDHLSEFELRLCLAKIKRRHCRTNLLVQGFKEYLHQKDLSEQQINDWLDEFFKLRISTNLLISQFLEMAEDESLGSEAEAAAKLDSYQSFISTQCDPLKIAQHAADVIQKLCEQWYGRAPKIIVTDAGAVPFTFVPRYMFYILSELLKNSVRATVEHSSDSMGPVTLVVCTGKGITSVRVSDEGGGIPTDSLTHVWSYLYTTAQPMDIPVTREGVDAPTELQRLEMSIEPRTSLSLIDETSEEHRILLRSPLAGLGCGLPLSKLYAEYLGGRMKLQTMPRYGTDVFVYLNSVGNSSEVLNTL
ncbi:unnamed protein product [Durusdinium trenchii]|uniref:Mitochondrial (AtPDHK) (Pyruvate dehydrogenase kinase) n=2 Tax=Durusdinium trenchii TaxID=1381693 RepID=A0ABP0MUE6_9DINO